MKNIRTLHKMTIALAAGGAGLLWMTAARADTLTFTNASARTVAASLGKYYGVTVVFRGSVNPSRPVTFSVDDAQTPGGQLEAVSSLASALDLDFQKVYVVSKVDPGAAVPPVKIDSNGPVVFRSTILPAREAIQAVAAVDGAMTQINVAVEGNVTLPSARMSASDAAAAIAKQTGTEWKAYYGMFPHGETPSNLSGTVVGQSNGGQAMTELPLVTYRNTISVPAPLITGNTAVVGPYSLGPIGPAITSVPDANFGAYPSYGPGGYGYTDPYGGLGYAAPNGGFAYPGSVVTPGVGVAPVVPGVNAPGVNAAAGPNGSATLLPTFPYMGSVGGQTTVGGY